MQTTNAKEPWLAVFLSSVFAGIGQIYGGDTKKGVSFVVIELTLSLTALACLLWFVLAASKLGITLTVVVGSGALFFPIYNLFDAFHTAKTFNQEHQLHLSERKKQPFLSLFLSSIIPGLGQVYNSQWPKGIGFFIGVGIINGILEAIKPIGPLVARIFSAVATLWILNDAYSNASKINGKSSSLIEKFGKQKVFIVLAIWFVVPMLLAGSLAFGIRTYLIRPYKIPNMAMAPTIVQGDRIFANQWTYRNQDPKRGDIIVFEYPLDPNKNFIKRVVGLPHEKIKIERGHIYIDGQMVNTPLIPEDRYYYNRDDWKYGKTGQTIDIPNDSYFVLGDNSAQSSDSRNWGFVPRRNIKAKGFWIWWPTERMKKIE